MKNRRDCRSYRIFFSFNLVGKTFFFLSHVFLFQQRTDIKENIGKIMADLLPTEMNPIHGMPISQCLTSYRTFEASNHRVRQFDAHFWPKNLRYDSSQIIRRQQDSNSKRKTDIIELCFYSLSSLTHKYLKYLIPYALANKPIVRTETGTFYQFLYTLFLH